MGLETCCMLAANIVAISAAGELLHARARSYTPTSRRTACILKLAAKSGLVSMAMLALRYHVPFPGGDKYLPSLPMVTMAHLFISVAQYNQRRASQPLNTPFSLYPSSRTFNSNVYTLSYFSWCFSIEPATKRLDYNVQLLLPPVSTKRSCLNSTCPLAGKS